MVSTMRRIKEQKRAIIRRHVQADNVKGLTQVLTTLTSLAVLWWAAVLSVAVSHWLTIAAVLLISLFSLRVFALMHECGHSSLFRTHRLNRAFGFLLGVVSGMPQYVWSRHHSYHHAHNGNWEKYRGLYTTLSVDEYAAMTDVRQRLYRHKCSIAFAPFAGLIYVIFNPRLTWLKGSVGLLSHIVKRKIAQPNLSMKAHAASFDTRYWRSDKRVLAYVLEQCRAAQRVGGDVLGIRYGALFFDLFKQRSARRRCWRCVVHGSAQF
jgi:omega-6 fatty acid desaturase (delta-12 desaturase)